MLFNIKIGEIVSLKDEDWHDIQAEVLAVKIIDGWEFVFVEDHINGTDGFVAHLYATGYPVCNVVFASIEEAGSQLKELVDKSDRCSIKNYIQTHERIFSGWVPNVKGDALRPIFHLRRKTEDGCKIIYFNETPKGYSVVVMQFAQGAKKKLFSKHFSRSNALLAYQDGLLEGYDEYYPRGYTTYCKAA